MLLGRCSGSPFCLVLNSRLRQTCRRRLVGGSPGTIPFYAACIWSTRSSHRPLLHLLSAPLVINSISGGFRFPLETSGALIIVKVLTAFTQCRAGFIPLSRSRAVLQAVGGGACVRSHLNKCRAAVALVRVVPLVRSAACCSFGVHRAPLPALVYSIERPAVRCYPLRFVPYACIVPPILYKVKL